MRAKIKKAWFYGWWFVRFLVKMSLSLIIAIPLRFSDKYKNLWLIMELPNEARDNGYWLYKYIVENHPEVNVRYVLKASSPDYAKMPAKDKIIRPYSWAHYISYVLCTRPISTHLYGASPGRYYIQLFKPLMPKKQRVFLQHGVTKEPIPLRGYADWIVTTSPTEAKHFAESGYKHPEKILQTGFCRFDNLSDLSKRQKQNIILIMPTFRAWLGGHTTVHERVFLESDFYKKWNALLNNREFIKWVEKQQYKVIFYPHRQMQAFAGLFAVGSENVEIATQSEYDVQDLLRKSSLLVTDYSSVFYDFSYMKKPVIFYPFDKKRFYRDHHRYSGKPYPFGEYVQTEADLVRAIKKHAKNGFKISDKVAREVDSFFAYADQNNCQRNFYAIKELGS